MDLVRSKSIDGLIVANMRTVDGQYVRQLSEQGFPIVVPGNGIEPFLQSMRQQLRRERGLRGDQTLD